jgi:hypothetical protein
MLEVQPKMIDVLRKKLLQLKLRFNKRWTGNGRTGNECVSAWKSFRSNETKSCGRSKEKPTIGL